MELSGGKNSGPLLITALVLALLFAVYYYVVLPKQGEAEVKRSAVDNLNREISAMREQIALIDEEKNGIINSGFTIRKKLPASREVNQLLLSFEEAEYISGSRILGISFNNYDSLVSTSGLVEPNEEAPVEGSTEENTNAGMADGDGTDETDSGTTDQQEEPVSMMSPESLPENLKMITCEIEVESPDYEQLQQFIREIEGLERIMHIDALEYTLPGEEEMLTEEASSVVSANIQVTTFYFE
ncbi:MAG: potassium transporter [Lysinibacillus sp.]